VFVALLTAEITIELLPLAVLVFPPATKEPVPLAVLFDPPTAADCVPDAVTLEPAATALLAKAVPLAVAKLFGAEEFADPWLMQFHPVTNDAFVAGSSVCFV
jgi:hypothetical protein